MTCFDQQCNERTFWNFGFQALRGLTPLASSCLGLGCQTLRKATVLTGGCGLSEAWEGRGTLGAEHSQAPAEMQSTSEQLLRVGQTQPCLATRKNSQLLCWAIKSGWWFVSSKGSGAPRKSALLAVFRLISWLVGLQMHAGHDASSFISLWLICGFLYGVNASQCKIFNKNHCN